jgi:hypothetical protein
MKTVNLNPKHEIRLEELTSNHIIGFRTKTCKETKGFVTRTSYEGTSFRLMANSAIHMGNGFMTFSTFDEVIRYFAKSALEVFVFDNERELFLWLAEPVS